MHCSTVLVPILCRPIVSYCIATCNQTNSACCQAVTITKDSTPISSRSTGGEEHWNPRAADIYCRSLTVQLHVAAPHVNCCICLNLMERLQYFASEPNPRSVNRRAIYQKEHLPFFVSFCFFFIPPSLILPLVALLKAVKGHYGKGRGHICPPIGSVCAWVTQFVVGRGWTNHKRTISHMNELVHDYINKSKKWVSVSIGKQVISSVKLNRMN